MKFVSWNVNGFRAVLQKGFDEAFIALDADIFCLQETKMQPGQASYDPPGYEDFWHSAQKKGYSGTAAFTRKEPLSVVYGIGEAHADEGRVMTLEYPGFYLVNAYVPNAQPELVRLPYRMAFEDAIREHLKALDRKKPVVYCGDLNVAHQEIDLKYPRANRGQPGFSDEEREKMTLLLGSGFTDSFRHLYPDKKEAYTWWSYRSNARASNAGWRIDYFVVSDRIKGSIRAAGIENQVFGSDHCPVSLDIDL
ncbi:MAG: exodeoxyribonuclease III [Clostridiales bacterium]|mgnify:CR=1 FL=1|nr:exodeoxyribonuclease III [Clostridiales bacterium]